MPKEKVSNEDRSPMFYYNCQHGASNTPCSKGCFSTGPGQPDPEPVPDDWMKSYKSSGDGLTDSHSIK